MEPDAAAPAAPDDGPAAAPDDGPAAAPDDGPAAAPDDGPAAAPDDGPAAAPAAPDDGPAAAPAAPDDGPAAAPAAPDDGPAMILSTYPNRTAALRAARRVVGDGLAACVNITDVTSVYTWQGRIEEDPECLAVFKTTRRARRALARSIAGAHPYEVPEVVEIGLRGADRPYAQWLAESTAAADATATEGGSGGSHC